MVIERLLLQSEPPYTLQHDLLDLMHLYSSYFLADIAHSDLLQFLQHRLLMVYDRVLTALPVESGPTRRL